MLVFIPRRASIDVVIHSTSHHEKAKDKKLSVKVARLCFISPLPYRIPMPRDELGSDIKSQRGGKTRTKQENHKLENKTV